MGHNILTHDRIVTSAPSTGVLSKGGIVWGGNALQSITIGRHTPKDAVQAVGFLGIVDYHSGVITSDVQLDCILVESSSKADIVDYLNSAYKYGAKTITIGTETYVLTSTAVSLQAGSPATVNYGFLTGTLASYLATQAAPAPLEVGEEAEFAVVMGDDGSGIYLAPDWAGTAPPAGTVPFLDANGVLNSSLLGDGGLPAGVQSVQFNAGINRDQILDVRTTTCIQFVTTYPIDVTMDMELYCLPSPSGTYNPGDAGYTGERGAGGVGTPAGYRHVMNKLQNVAVQAKNWNKHPNTPAPAGTATLDDAYVQARGLTLEDESEAISVGRYLMYTFKYKATDLILPLPTNP